VDIIDAGGLSRAAVKLKVRSANVSQRLQQVEKATGVQLIRRTTRHIEPIEIGLTLHRHGKNIRDEVMAAEEAVSMLGRALHGLVRVRVRVATGFGQGVMTDWLIEFKQRYPDINLELQFENRVDDLLREEVDVAIRVMTDLPDALIAKELGGGWQYVACASAAYVQAHGLPEHLDELRQVPVITSPAAGRELRVAGYLGAQRHEVKLQPSIASENFQFLHKAILADLGVGLVQRHMVAQDIFERRVVISLTDWRLSIFGSRLFLLRTPERCQTLAVRTLSVS
jgi:DNA-binding transcriptional LysR family regulator